MSPERFTPTGAVSNIFYPATDDSENQVLFEREGELLLSILKKYLMKAIPIESTAYKSLLNGSWEAVLDIVHFDSAKAPLINEDIVGCTDISENLQTIREVVLQAHPSRHAYEKPRFDCVGCVDQHSESPKKSFRAQVLKFFQISASSIRDETGESLAECDHIFALVGSFRTVLHKPYKSYNHHFEDGRECTRAALLGKTIIKLPPNHIKADVSNWLSQRFAVVSLRDIKSTIHVIPLVRADGSPLLARFDADLNMHPSIPALAKKKQLHLMNDGVYI